MSHWTEAQGSLERLMVGLIRSGNAGSISMIDSDRDLLDAYGHSARPFAEAILQVIRDEVRAIHAETSQGDTP